MRNLKSTILAGVITGLIVAAVIAFTKTSSKSQPVDHSKLA